MEIRFRKEKRKWLRLGDEVQTANTLRPQDGVELVAGLRREDGVPAADRVRPDDRVLAVGRLRPDDGVRPEVLAAAEPRRRGGVADKLPLHTSNWHCDWRRRYVDT